MKTRTVAWFSTGASSAVAIKLALALIDDIIYIHIEDQHPDSIRFIKDCEQWYGRRITLLQSPYKNVANVCLSQRYINGVHGAKCTQLLKKRVRIEWEAAHEYEALRYVWGMDCSAHEIERAKTLEETLPEFDHLFPLIHYKKTKEDAHQILAACGIKRPTMYDLGYLNNNCIGCVKGGMGYWNKIRVDFPQVFAQRAEMERIVGASCINGIYLDELAPGRGRDQKPIVGECGILCEYCWEGKKVASKCKINLDKHDTG